jgi:hypothetical protein
MRFQELTRLRKTIILARRIPKKKEKSNIWWLVSKYCMMEEKTNMLVMIPEKTLLKKAPLAAFQKEATPSCFKTTKSLGCKAFRLSMNSS